MASKERYDEKVDIPVVEETSPTAGEYDENEPTEEELSTLRRVPGNLPLVAYLICVVEFSERASYLGVSGLISNFVNRPMPVGGNGYGAPPRGTQQTAGALGMGTVKANAVNQSFSMLAYVLPMLFGYLSDAHTGRFKMIFWGVFVFGVAHVLMVGAAAPTLLANGGAKAPFFISLYMLSVGAAMFKPNVSPLLLDQMPTTKARTKLLSSGEKVIVDPEVTTERAMLWFYLLINIGGFMQVATSYAEKYVGWWLAFILPLFLYLPLPALLFWLRKRLVLHPPGGSDLLNVVRVLRICLAGGGIFRVGRHGFWDAAKPSVIAANGERFKTHWNDQFVEDVRRAFQATGIFCFFPIQFLNDNGLGNAASFLSTMLTTNGVPNDVISNFNALSIIVFAPILNYMLYPLLRRLHIRYGPVARITTGLALSSIGGVGYTVLNYYAYKLGPCGKYGSSDTCVDADGVSLVAPISIWWMAIPYALGGISELFVNVPAYGIAYSRAPKNMRGVVSAVNLLNTAVAYAIGLACSAVVRDPYLTWVFGGPSIVGGVLTVIFYFMFRHIDKEEYMLSEDAERVLELEGTGNTFTENSYNKTTNPTPAIAANEDQTVIAINNMEATGWSNDRFRQLSRTYAPVLRDGPDGRDENVRYAIVPVSSGTGDNLVTRTSNMPWFHDWQIGPVMGATLWDAINAIQPLKPKTQEGPSYDSDSD
ncbi:oligopeptide transporter [Aspergillus bombycis]|uniref:Oligopeptide transporter n=1 Tax=Aspergillus bombycis TaxID=109264 RepID=A0A1F8A0S7_9EURO|nr:oligopeptide transporter [Aspergillus bombycis]OGM45330.1 oligopeptide transporter [Aspergillus bombycis]